MKGLLKAIIAGALIWIAINLVAMGYQPAKAESVIATVEDYRVRTSVALGVETTPSL